MGFVYYYEKAGSMGISQIRQQTLPAAYPRPKTATAVESEAAIEPKDEVVLSAGPPEEMTAGVGRQAIPGSYVVVLPRNDFSSFNEKLGQNV
ncbi:MAG: hypothetical protein KC800_11080, partial [Candidatus Eremiobacteraeota bacterium]|nr:hypothetical protein [Candidatus Eremiobacteraeota bacterium]